MSVAHPRLSIRREDVARCEAVVIPLVADGDGVLREDRTQAPLLVPLALLGCKVEMTELSAGSAYTSRTCRAGMAVVESGGPPLRALVVDESMFAATAMMGGAGQSLAEMKLPSIKGELAAQGSTHSGLKAVLQRRLHGLLVQAAIKARLEDDEEWAPSGGGGPSRGSASDGKRPCRR